MPSNMSRRTFVGSAAAAGVMTVLPRHVLGGAGYVAPSGKVTVAHIGMGTQGLRELGALLAEPEVQVVAVCDPNTDTSDYVEWSKGSVRRTIRELLGDASWRAGDDGCPGGREVGREVVDTWYANHRKNDGFRACAAYADFRELLTREKDVDAVKIMTPDHLHATIAIAAMTKGKHVVMHKPLANRLAEGRRVIDTARQTKVGTHLLAYGSGTANGQIARRVKEGVIGPLREIHNWSNRPVWPQYTQVPTDTPPVPKGFDWTLWLGPAVDRPYHPHYTHTVFRGWYDFGGGSMADMGIYSLWPVFTALALDAPVSAEAWGSHTCAIVDGVSRPVQNDAAYPAACAIRFRFGARSDMPALDLFWYDGGMKPRLPAEVEAQNVAMSREGILFVGDEGTIMAGFHGQNPRLFTKGKSEPLSLEGTDDGDAKRNAWLAAYKGEASPGSFPNAASITDAVNLGTVALQAGKRVDFDSTTMRITNAASANAYLRRAYRPGWEL
ncbi:MAG: Gfo/Idh/MocA family oxidoreductase [Planctomycetes bacterium]|nr:Gfo/Idh/MocA family oxidoreductase [Planctomycetota bacterium]